MLEYKGRKIRQTMLWEVLVWRVEGSRFYYLTLEDAKEAVDCRGAPLVDDTELRQRIAARTDGKTWIGKAARYEPR
jgi:hypothetical protein